jgi:FMN-dependent oxidoreductase (nitrilotriacetate monooxygenase family)
MQTSSAGKQMTQREIHLNLFMRLQGNHLSGWRHPKNRINEIVDIDYYIEIARKVEAAKFDSLFIADGLSVINHPWKGLSWLFEPLTLLSALAVSTKHIGLIATASTTYSDPFSVARAFASLDHISKGRAAWNIVTTFHPESAANFGDRPIPEHATRYDRAAEFVDVVRKLWDSWEADALVRNKAQGTLVDYDKVHAIDHKGPYFDVRGPLTSPRPPQGHPLLVQAGASASGQKFAGAYADAIYAPGDDFDQTLAFTKQIREATERSGRPRNAISVLAALCPVLADTEQAAKNIAQELHELSTVDHVYGSMRSWFGLELSEVGPDEAIPHELLPEPDQVQGLRSRYEQILRLIKDKNYTLRDIAKHLEGSNDGGYFVGTPEQLADRLGHWWETGAVDGFNLSLPYYDEPLDIFINEVLPILQKRGQFRTDYAAGTLRDRFRG